MLEGALEDVKVSHTKAVSFRECIAKAKEIVPKSQVDLYQLTYYQLLQYLLPVLSVCYSCFRFFDQECIYLKPPAPAFCVPAETSTEKYLDPQGVPRSIISIVSCQCGAPVPE